ncbi:MAG TPA: methyltransferase domain-containing protein [Ferrovibrio sp.]|uniref:class I SAM-dependent methyltransferase n=1 Tax=Ferrovibrio sp. TaxID=1917215 RepID=UPI002B4AD5EB|nr:methyltransferase domain-containing protein [Ferrovibrio sp.]HLT77264.1 methyltransferase domain-containing protein [Ferrovibrio sp.]
MLRPDIIDLREFYADHLGQAVRRLLRQRLRAMWSDVSGLRVMGLGYATPYLRIFENEAERVIAAMPGPQGVVRWPRGLPGRVMLVDEDDLPLPDASIDRLLLVHSVENSENVRSLLREVWRVLSPQGRLLAVVPNRRGLWAHIETTPFGQGHPYTPPQLTRLMRDAEFSPTRSEAALWMPPANRGFVFGAAQAWERTGEALWKRFSGVLLVEAEKQVYAVTPLKAVKVRQKRFVLNPVPAGLRPVGFHGDES